MDPQNSHPLADWNAYARDLLVVVGREGPSNGMVLKPALDAARGEASTQTHFYDKLNELVDASLVDKTQLSKRENSYEATEDGREAIHRTANWMVGR